MNFTSSNFQYLLGIVFEFVQGVPIFIFHFTTGLLYVWIYDNEQPNKT